MQWNSNRTIQIPKEGCHQGFAFITSANLEDPAVPTWWKMSILIPISKKGSSTKEYANHLTITLISHASKIMLKISLTRLQYYVNQEHPDLQTGFRKGRGTRDQIANIHWIVEKARGYQGEKNSLFHQLFYWDCVQFSSVVQSCLILCDHMDCSKPGFPVHHQLPELDKTHLLSHWCHPTTSSSIIPFSSCLQSFSALGSFLMR